MDQYDAVISPTCPITPPSVQKLLKMTIFLQNQIYFRWRNTRVANLLGLTSVTLPTEIDNCGLMLLSKPNDEINLLKAHI